MTNLVAGVRTAVRAHPNAAAISVAGRETTYAEFWALTGRFAGALRERGFEPGAPVALSLPNLPQFVVAFYGVLRAGGTVVPIDPRYDESEIRPPLTESAAVAIVTTGDHVDRIEAVHEHTILQFMITADGPGQYSTGFSEFLAEAPDVYDYWEVTDRDADDVAVLAYTAGTTADPKGVALTHHNVASNTHAISDLAPDGISPTDRVLGGLPFFHSAGMTTVMNATLTSGGTLVPMHSWDAGTALSLIESEEITMFHGHPEMYTGLVAHPDAGESDLSSLRMASVFGAPVHAELLDECEKTFGVPIYEGYGVTETTHLTHFNAPTGGRRIGSVGKPIDGASARIVDDAFEDISPVEEGPVDGTALDGITGELVVSGPNVMAQYHGYAEKHEEPFTEDDGKRWFHTGDIAYSDEDGYFYVVGRADEIDPGATDATDEHGDEPEGATAAAPELVAEVSEEAEGAEEGTQTETTGETDAEAGVVELQDLAGISESRAATLRDAGFESVADLRAATREELTAVEGFGDALVDRIEEQVDANE